MLTLMQLHERFPAESDEQDMAWDMAENTLRAISLGGIHDHLGGGFHRYSVDAYWHVPHYEKMLYDQAQLTLAYLGAWQISQDEIFRKTAESTLDYVISEMRDPGGAFHSAEDADSLRRFGDAHKHEGAFWTWTAEEISSLLEPKPAAIFSMAYGVEAEGNARPESDPHGDLEGQNTLFRALGNDKLAEAFGLSEDEIARSLAESRSKLLTHRATRPKPHRDDKIITAWNGLMISALAQAAAAFQSERYLIAATDAARFIRENLWAGTLHRSHRGKCGSAKAFPADYAFLIAGLIDLHAADTSGGWLDWAVELQAVMDRETWSEEKIGYVMSSEINGTTLLTIREDYDGAEPSPNHVAALNLLRLAVLTDTEAFAKRAESLLRAGAGTLAKQVFAAPVLLAAHDLHHRSVQHFKIPTSRYKESLARLTATHRPRAVFTPHDGDQILLCEGMTCRIFAD
jgi:uncharacterized protein YyaL (SSP411 family)